MKWKLIPTKDIKALEMVFPNHLNILGDMIRKDGILKKPLIVDKDNYIVLDGSHRHVWLAMEGYKQIPCILVDYSSSDVRVGTHLKHRFIDDGNIRLTKEEVIMRGVNQILLLPRTTRHYFIFRKEDINIPLSQLPKGKPMDMSSHIANVDIQKEIDHNYKYIQEIDEEINEIHNYIYEQEQTKRYLQQQIKMMEKRIGKSAFD